MNRINDNSARARRMTPVISTGILRPATATAAYRCSSLVKRVGRRTVRVFEKATSR